MSKYSDADVYEALAEGGKTLQDFKKDYIKTMPNGAKTFNRLQNEFIKQERADYRAKNIGKAKKMIKSAGRKVIGTAKKIGEEFEKSVKGKNVPRRVYIDTEVNRMIPGGDIFRGKPAPDFRGKKQKTGTTEKGGLKPVPKGDEGKGLSMLSPEVRNKMGFMKKGGSAKKQYGYMGGGKVYPQPRTARRPMSGE